MSPERVLQRIGYAWFLIAVFLRPCCSKMTTISAVCDDDPVGRLCCGEPAWVWALVSAATGHNSGARVLLWWCWSVLRFAARRPSRHARPLAWVLVLVLLRGGVVMFGGPVPEPGHGEHYRPGGRMWTLAYGLLGWLATGCSSCWERGYCGVVSRCWTGGFDYLLCRV